MKKILFGLILAAIILAMPLTNLKAQDVSPTEENVVMWWAREASTSGELYITHETESPGVHFNMTHYKVWEIYSYWGVGVNTTISTSVEDSILTVNLEGNGLVNITINGYMHDIITVSVSSIKANTTVYIDILRQVDMTFIESFEAPLDYQMEFPVNIYLGAVDASVNITHMFANGTVRTETMDVNAEIWMNATLFLNVSSYIVGYVTNETGEVIKEITWENWGEKTIDLTGYSGDVSVSLEYNVEYMHAKFYDITTTTHIDTDIIENKSGCAGLGMFLKNGLKKATQHKFKWRVGEQTHGKHSGREFGGLGEQETETIDVFVQSFTEAIYQATLTIGEGREEGLTYPATTWVLIGIGLVIIVGIVILVKRK